MGHAYGGGVHYGSLSQPSDYGSNARSDVDPDDTQVYGGGVLTITISQDIRIDGKVCLLCGGWKALHVV